MPWERCGNTPFYRKSEGRETLFANPLNWSQVSVGAEKEGEWQGIAKVEYKKAPRYDWEVLKKGVAQKTMSEDRRDVLRATHEWFVDWLKAKESSMSTREFIRAFKTLPDEERNFILEGVTALVTGYGTAITGSVVIAVERDSPAYRDINDLRQLFDYAQRFYVESSIAAAVDEALGHFGIYEC